MSSSSLAQTRKLEQTCTTSSSRLSVFVGCVCMCRLSHSAAHRSRTSVTQHNHSSMADGGGGWHPEPYYMHTETEGHLPSSLTWLLNAVAFAEHILNSSWLCSCVVPSLGMRLSMHATTSIADDQHLSPCTFRTSAC